MFLFFKKNGDSKFYELDENSWYDTEIDDDGNTFVWSKEEGIIKLFNVDNIKLEVRCPIGRDITIKCGNIDFKKTLIHDRSYVFYVECVSQDKLSIGVDKTFSTESDVRELGIQVKNIEIYD